MGAPRAFVVDGVTEGKQRPAHVVQFGQFAQQQIVDHGAHQIDRVGRASGNLERFNADGLADPLVATRVGGSGLNAAESCTGAVSNNGRRLWTDVLGNFEE